VAAAQRVTVSYICSPCQHGWHARSGEEASMLLAMDVGNTNIVLGVFAGDRLVDSWRLATLRERTTDEIGILLVHLFEHRRIERSALRGAVLSSVVPPLTGTMIDVTSRYFGITPLVVDHTVDVGLTIRYDNPAEVGADRLVNGLAAYERVGRPAHAAAIVVDFGTATTFDAISAQGEYLGGAICPGVQISADALFQRAARLPRVDVRKPPALIGRNTVQSMQAGLFFGYVAMVEGIVARMAVELTGRVSASGPGPRAVCIGTGGLAGVIAAETKSIERVEPDLTLHGLRLVWERNQPGRA
jgi:type III pantothenate kinase